MKKITLLVASILLVGNVAKATEVKTISGEESRVRISFDEPISFIERGIEFFVFPNGDFDFNTRPQDSQGDYFYRKANGRVTAVQARGNVNYGVLIQHDSFGRVRRVGNTFINYDNRDRVSRIGTVYMRYNRFALSQIGGMTLVYNYRGDIINTIGSIKGRGNQGFVYNTYNSNNHYNDYASNNTSSNNYYYRSQGDEDKQEEVKGRK
ncbi:hypothetical protein [Flavobacterium capsici]|uniref:Uncharacterized protein n=1 Tax=Flavobacterium capsici TaxID=3075618 RepID=A0AA96F5Q2_9FLAO|nr:MULTISPECIES: hypothetical protein [unclassified Flavobacterium]WNM18054.1 hypothetical protein RN608_08520 [Flavobacterium sp. PMR2A8]WNM22106.1 hypothetical protein RN605_01820 [Flavobacterium sp. PMTSA4]